MAKRTDDDELKDAAHPTDGDTPDSSPDDDADTPPKPKRRLKNQCTATSRNSGRRCGNAAIPGGRVCRFHGGASPQVQRSARMRLMEEVLPSIERLAKERDTAKRPADRIRASAMILDRAGYGPQVKIAHDESRSLLLERLTELRREAEAQGKLKGMPVRGAAADDEPDDDNIVDAEIVE